MKPMKSESLMDREGTLHLNKIIFPKLVSPKYDGNRCYIENGEAKSSSGKPIRNDFIRESLSMDLLSGFDGELIVGSPTAVDVRRKTSSGVGTKTGEPDFRFYVFDNYLVKGHFETRLNELRNHVDIAQHPRVLFVRHKHVYTLADLLRYESEVLHAGYEGVMLRCLAAPYKEGRSTAARKLVA